MPLTLAALQQEVESINEHEQNAIARAQMQFAKDRLSRHELDAIVAKIHHEASNRIGVLIQQATR